MSDERVEAQVMGVYMHQDQSLPQPQHFVLLRDNRGRRVPIWVGQFEAWAIAFSLEGEAPDRPFTHDLLLNCLTAGGMTVEEAYIHEVRDETFYATLTLRRGDETLALDARPSDAVAVALRAKRPIFISDAVMAASQR